MHSQTKILISVIITTYNRSIFLSDTLDSIQNQTFQNIEILVIDDGSKSEIAQKNNEICNQFSKCTYYYKPNSGQPSSRNYGIERAKGDFIGFCDDDDYWVLNKLEKQLKVLNENPNFDIVVGNIEYIDCNNKSLKNIKSHYPNNHGYVFENFLIKNRTDSVTPLLRKSVFEKSGLFNANFTLSEDWDFWRKVSYHHKFYAIDEVLAFVRKHNMNMTGQERTHIDGLELYNKLTKSLLKWGEFKISYQDKRKISDLEFQHYNRHIGNNYNSIIKKANFFLELSIKKPMIFIRMIQLFIIKITT
jgi:glycosyltransferase involved in cell wall biosynthesis